MAVTLSVVIPATNEPPKLARVLAAVEQADTPPEEVIVVEEPPNAGPATARNLGSKRASGDVLVFVDADVEVHADAFARIREAFDEDRRSRRRLRLVRRRPRSGRTGLRHPQPAPSLRAPPGRRADRDVPHPSIEDIELGARLHRDGARLVLDPSIQG